MYAPFYLVPFIGGATFCFQQLLVQFCFFFMACFFLIEGAPHFHYIAMEIPIVLQAQPADIDSFSGRPISHP
jgi:hypothetical protein